MTGNDDAVIKAVEKMKQLMQEQGVSMQQLARDSGVSVATVSRILNGLTAPKFGNLYDMFYELGIELDIVGYTLEGGIKRL